ncbi:YrhK [Sulfitobacter noctilucae]|uniref:YrhK family protein n=1 Tax=Sulfitobacter noctilucae TaxID=1342302 RepID=UPI0004689090|nr:YrhK family protein [Sulfitobacter noctilucae]KIN65393.1 YrhK [Sulfitobacter noctilucae]
MQLFRHETRQSTEEAKQLFAVFELLHTLADFGAATLFIIGSIMFFFDQWVTFGTWLFLVGSILFALKPTLKLWREIRLYRMKEYQTLAKRDR